MTIEERQRLAEKYIPLARTIAKKYKVKYPSRKDDFESEALFALTDSAMRFDPERNQSFSNYVKHRLGWAMVDVEREIYDQSKSEPFEDYSAYVDHHHEFEMDDAALHVLRGLSKVDKKIVYDIAVLGKMKQDVAREFSKSPSWVGVKYEESLKFMRERV